jgi:hypothetical protein
MYMLLPPDKSSCFMVRKRLSMKAAGLGLPVPSEVGVVMMKVHNFHIHVGSA